MSNKPLIGINGDFRPARKDAIALSWFNTGYYDSISATRLKTGNRETDFISPIPVLLPPLADDNDLRQMLQMLDGIVLSGCAQDLDPVRLGMEKHPHTRPMPSRREDFDRRLCRMAVEMRMPILAIGGGMQLLNVICGGTIFQHVMEDCPKALHHRQRGDQPAAHSEHRPRDPDGQDVRPGGNSGEQQPSPGGEHTGEGLHGLGHRPGRRGGGD
jgi:putative glutamine amidotransferase